jgi:hypothetical protein
LWVQGVKLLECIYSEILDLITIFAKFPVEQNYSFNKNDIKVIDQAVGR